MIHSDPFQRKLVFHIRNWQNTTKEDKNEQNLITRKKIHLTLKKETKIKAEKIYKKPNLQ